MKKLNLSKILDFVGKTNVSEKSSLYGKKSRKLE